MIARTSRPLVTFPQEAAATPPSRRPGCASAPQASPSSRRGWPAIAAGPHPTAAPAAPHRGAPRATAALPQRLLRDSPTSASPDFQYVLDNAAYFDIELSMHGNAWAVAWVQDAGISCAPTLARLREIEAPGESEPAWTVRKYFLDRAL